MPHDVQLSIEKSLRDYYLKSGKRPFPKNLRLKMKMSEINTPELQRLFMRKGIEVIPEKASKKKRRSRSRRRRRR